MKTQFKNQFQQVEFWWTPHSFSFGQKTELYNLVFIHPNTLILLRISSGL